MQNTVYKKTKPRTEILAVLTGYPRTVQEIHEAVKQRELDIDLTTVYRTLELFVKLGIVHEIELGEGKKRYERVEKDNHHHHLICTDCGKIDDISIDCEHDIIHDIVKSAGFVVERHSMEFFGTCKSCQAK